MKTLKDYSAKEKDAMLEKMIEKGNKDKQYRLVRQAKINILVRKAKAQGISVSEEEIELELNK